MKAVTPVVALVMLMLITVGMVGSAYVWFSGLFTMSTEKAISLPPGSSYCTQGFITVIARNEGTQSNILLADIKVAMIDDTDVTGSLVGFPISPSGGKAIISNYPSTSGRHKIRIATATSVAETSVNCP